MNEQAPHSVKNRAGTRHSRLELLSLSLVLLVSLGLRLFDLDVFLAGDETKWMCRSILFHDALRRGDLGATYQTEHPGVVTMWLGALAVPLAQAGEWTDLCATTGGSELTRVQDRSALARLASLIFQVRRLAALTTWLGIVALYWLLKRLLGGRTALLATAFVALDPFHLALSRVLHLDALLATFMALSLVSLLLYGGQNKRKGYLILSAVAGGLATANKSPGLFLFAWTALYLGARAWGTEPKQRRERLLTALRAMVLWGMVAVGVVIVLWPALWVDPLGTLQKVFGAAVGYAQEPHGGSNYFWFAVRPDPGPAFYPVAWAFRTTPWVMVGLASLAIAVRKRSLLTCIIPLLLFALVFAALMTVGAKKFDRYLLPVFLILDILAAIGWMALLGLLTDRLPSAWRRVAPGGATILLAAVQLVLVLPCRPYYFSYYNPLLGGARAATRVLLVGWGEGLEKAAEYLNAKPGADKFHVNTGHISQFAPFFRGHTSGLNDLDLAESDYYVFYWNYIQRRREPQTLDRFYGVEQPEYVVNVHGIDYVWIYANTLYRPALDYLHERADPQRDVVLLDMHAGLSRHYAGPLPLAVVDGSVSEDHILAGLARATAGRQRVWYLTFPDVPGDSRGLIHHHLSQQATKAQEVSLDGMQIARYDLHPDARFVPPSPEVEHEVYLDEAIMLVGYDLVGGRLCAGETMVIRLYWRCTGSVPTSYTVFTHLLGPDGERYGQRDSIPVGGSRPTTSWLAGDTIVDEYQIQIALDAPPGEYQLAVGMYDFNTGLRLPAFDADGHQLPENRTLIRGLAIEEKDCR